MRLDFPFSQIATGDLDIAIIGQLPATASHRCDGSAVAYSFNGGSGFGERSNPVAMR